MLKRLMATTAVIAIASSAYAANTTTTQNSVGAGTAPAMSYVNNVNPGDALATKLIGQPVYRGTATMASNAGAPTDNGMAQGNGAQQGNMQAQNGTATNAANPPADAANPPATMAQNNAANPPATTAQNNAVPNNQDRIGDINNLVVAKDGSIEAVIIGVGGFLGMGEKNVAVPFHSLTWSTDADGKRMAYLDTTEQQLKNAPSFDVSALEQNRQGAPGTANPANTQTAANAPAAGQNAAVGTANDGAPAVDSTKISANELMNTTVYDAQNQNVGNVGDVIMTKDGKIDAIVVDIGGFLGIGEKPVAIAFEDLNIQKDQNGKLALHTGFTKQQLDNAPQYNKDTYAQQRDQMRLHTQS